MIYNSVVRRLQFFLIVSLLITSAFCASAKENPVLKEAAAKEATGASVVIDGQPLFTVQERIGSFTAEDRAKAVSRRLEQLSRDYKTRIEALQGVDTGSTTDIVAGDLVLMTLTDQDAKAAGRPRQELAQDYAQKIRAAVLATRKTYSLHSLALGALWSLLASLALILFVKGLNRVFPRFYAALRSLHRPMIRNPRLKVIVDLFPAERITEIGVGLVQALRLGISLAAFYLYLSLVFSFFPWTRGLARQLLDYVLSPLNSLYAAGLGYLPNLFFVAVISVVTWYLLKLIRLIFEAVRQEHIHWPGFYPEWARPTYQIVRFLIIAFAVVVAFPYLPGSHSPAFKGISVFLGVLFSLGSTSAVANIVAGLVLTYMRPFKLGDRVKISDTTGDVVEKTLLVTRIHTIKSEDITIPNAMILGSHIINFSSSAQDEGLILHTTVTIGYDAPWRKVHELLISAAQTTEHILKTPVPFVFQTSLDDSFVSYEINAYTDRPTLMAKIYSDLHQNIQDKFNEGGIEIVSPRYTSVRDGNITTLPLSHRPKGYKPGVFRISAKDSEIG